MAQEILHTDLYILPIHTAAYDNLPLAVENESLFLNI